MSFSFMTSFIFVYFFLEKNIILSPKTEYNRISKTLGKTIYWMWLKKNSLLSFKKFQYWKKMKILLCKIWWIHFRKISILIFFDIEMVFWTDRIPYSVECERLGLASLGCRRIQGNTVITSCRKLPLKSKFHNLFSHLIWDTNWQ